MKEESMNSGVNVVCHPVTIAFSGADSCLLTMSLVLRNTGLEIRKSYTYARKPAEYAKMKRTKH
jgi:hypothetical protein